MTQYSGPRTRIFEDVANNQSTRFRSRNPCTAPWSAWAYNPSYPVYYRFDSMSDVVTPNYHAIVASGGIVNNPMQRTTIKIDVDKIGTYSSRSNVCGYDSEFDGPGSLTDYTDRVLLPGGPSNTLDTSHLLQQAAQAAIAGIDATPYQFMEDLLEFHKTLAFLRDPFSGAAELAERFAWKRQRNLRKGMDLVSATAGAWLTYRYAMRPLAISISNGLSEYQNKVLARKTGLAELGSFGQSRRTSRNFQSGRDYSEGYFYVGTDPAQRWTFWKSKEITAEVRCGVIYEVKNPISSFAEINGLRLKDLPHNLYNIVPYSWVLEHFISVEKSIKGMVNLADPKVNILAAWQVVDENVISKKRLISRTQPGNTYTIDGDTMTTETRTVSREPWLPSFSDTLPVTNLAKAKDAGFILDMASLVVKRLSPPVKRYIGRRV